VRGSTGVVFRFWRTLTGSSPRTVFAELARA
jgi:hypothetical protein